MRRSGKLRPEDPHPASPRGEDSGRTLFGGGLVVRVLKVEGANSTRTPFFHGEGHVETGGIEFNRKQFGGNWGPEEKRMCRPGVRGEKLESGVKNPIGTYGDSI